MSADVNSKPKPMTPVVVAHGLDNTGNKELLRLLPAVVLSGLFHVVLFGAFFLLIPSGQAETQLERKEEATPVNTDAMDETKKDPFLTTDVDPAAQEYDTDINYNVDRTKAEVSVPGT